MAMPEAPVPVIILSRNRPLYLWTCLDALYRYTRHPARFILVDNQSDDPLVRQVVTGFERRGMFEAVEWHDSNSPKRVAHALARHRDPASGYMVIIESDVAVFDSDPCWLTRMAGIMTARPELAILGSYLDTRDFVDPARARRLEPDMAPYQLDGLIKAQSPERRLPPAVPPETVIDPFNPPGRLVMVRHAIMDIIPFGTDGLVYNAIKAAGLEAGIATGVRHRHLSLLNLFDYADYDVHARDAFVQANDIGSMIPKPGNAP